jgi:hypothetical protein
LNRSQAALANGVAAWHIKRMNAAELKQLLHATPFRPFTVYLASEKAFAVPHVDFAALSPTGRTLIVFRKEDGVFDILDVPLIARLEVQETAAP